jgi:hypothetical protein
MGSLLKIKLFNKTSLRIAKEFAIIPPITSAVKNINPTQLANINFLITCSETFSVFGI